MYNAILSGLQKFSEYNNLSLTYTIGERLDSMMIVRFTDNATGKRMNLAINMYDRLNVSDEEIIRDITNQVKTKLLRKKEIK